MTHEQLWRSPRVVGGEPRSTAMTAGQVLEHATDAITRRRGEYGEPAVLFDQVAKRWSLTLGIEVSPAQVTMCLVDLKLAQLANDPKHIDSIVDAAGYAALLVEVT